MLKTIILLTGSPDHLHALSLLLREHNPGLSICTDVAASELDLLEPEELRDARLVCFGNAGPIPDNLVRQIGHGAYRFYSAAVQHPAHAPSTAAEAAEDAACLSVIAQAIGNDPRFDAVIGIETVTLPPDVETAARERIAFTKLAHLFWRMSHAIACEAELSDVERKRLN
ncbi:hypothetical protein [Rhodopseudomonas sp. B29]|uniref:hypothetical protein n=1 Tax=Rhodopseudomonas sp. B29 TaxID=95607 RepID=UPI000347A3C2|nr:hypothetical protein [Rhodopseudomonas sp. B29]